jgi:hypothetical protein
LTPLNPARAVYTRSITNAFAMPPPSHMACSP